jgi:hypothetical protein
MKKLFLVVAIVAVVAVCGFNVSGRAQGNNQEPSADAVAFAQRTSDLLLTTIVAALTQEFDETTPANVEEGKHSIGLIFDDENDNMRLVGSFGPLSENDLPQDAFEVSALNTALTSFTAVTAVERVRGKWYYRRSIPLSNFRSECALCHTNFPPGPTSDRVGALMLRVPIQ